MYRGTCNFTIIKDPSIKLLLARTSYNFAQNASHFTKKQSFIHFYFHSPDYACVTYLVYMLNDIPSHFTMKYHIHGAKRS